MPGPSAADSGRWSTKEPAVILCNFGAGHAGLGLLVEFHLPMIKIDRELVRGLDADPARQAVVREIVGIARQLGITVLAAGVGAVA